MHFVIFITVELLQTNCLVCKYKISPLVIDYSLPKKGVKLVHMVRFHPLVESERGALSIVEYFFVAGLTFTEKWNTDNVLNTEITIEDQITKGLKLAFDTSFAPQTGYGIGF